MRLWIFTIAIGVFAVAYQLRFSSQAEGAHADNSAAPPPLVVTTATAAEPLTRAFRRRSGWSGGDSAYSISLSADKTLWLFGDSWIGRIDKGKRVDSTMVSNTAAWQSLREPHAPLHFFWRTRGKNTALPLLNPPGAASRYWPLDGSVVDGKLYLFVQRIRNRTDLPGPFAFEVLEHELLQIENPNVEPTKWLVHRVPLPPESRELGLGVACLPHAGYLYVFGNYPEKSVEGINHRLVVSRIAHKELGDSNYNWEYFTKAADATEGRWSKSASNIEVLVAPAAPELTIGTVRGVTGFVATYLPFPGRKILVRHATRPEGPWSEPETAYSCPETGKGLLLYSAKNHPELAVRAGQMVVTYCRNSASFEQHIIRPDIYFPQAILINIKTTH